MFSNPYKGINAHLHSLAQNPDNQPSIWPSIHASHIAHITIFQTGTRTKASLTGAALKATRVVSIETLLEDDEISMGAAVIYALEGHDLLGSPITRIELLSQSNKRPPRYLAFRPILRLKIAILTRLR